MNFANVRSAIGLTIALALSLAVAPAAASPRPIQVRLLWVPPQTTVKQLAASGLSPGLLSAGLGKVPANQTYLDVGQGNRVFDSLYDSDLPSLPSAPSAARCRRWQAEVGRRAESAPAEIVPFLLAERARASHVGLAWSGEASCAMGGAPDGTGARGDAGTLLMREGSLPDARRALAGLRGRDLLIAIARPTGESDAPLPIGIGGRGFRGDLTSDTTRTDGYVASTDVAPTILGRYGIEVPGAMSGQPIRSQGSVDAAAVEARGGRMAAIPERRGPVVGLNVVAWLIALLVVALASRGRWARVATCVVGLAVVYLPLVLLLAAWPEPGEPAERLLALLLPPLLGAATLAALRGYRALAVASAVTVLAYAADAIAGSPLTSLSLLGPNPGLGVRFYGIGNELEALLVVLVVAGTGAWLAGFGRPLGRRRAALAFLLAGLASAFVFAAGRFGADVGAAIVFPAGATVAAATVAGRRRRWTAIAVLAAPAAVLALLALIDLASGANAHLTRSVLDAGGLGDLADVAQRRLQLSAHSFGRPILLAFLPAVALLAALAYVRRDRVAAWLEPAPAMRAGLLGAAVATAIGTLANDSGALVLEVGSAYLLVFLAFAWAERPEVTGLQTKSYNHANYADHTSHPYP